MFALAACRSCQLNRKTVCCNAIIRCRNILSERTFNRKYRSLKVIHGQWFIDRKEFKIGIWDKSRLNLACSKMMCQKRSSLNVMNIFDKTCFKCTVSFTQSKRMSSSENGQRRESIITIPNLLCLTRIALAPVMAYLLMQSHHSVALTLLGVAGATDMLDGFVARNFKNQSSVFGSMLDPLADKFLMTVMTITLAYVNLLPAYLCALIVGRDIGIVSAVAVLRFKTVPRPLTVSKFFDVNLPTVQMKPTFISKVNTGLQLALVGLCMAAPVFDFVGNYWLQAYWYLVAGTTIISGMSYVVKGKQTFRVVR